MNIEQTMRDGVCVLSPSGRLDAVSSPDFKQTVQDMVEQGRTRLVVDFSGITFMDSSGLGALIASSRTLQKQDGDIRLACLSDTIRQIMGLTRADRMFDIFDSVDGAVAGFGSGEIS